MAAAVVMGSLKICSYLEKGQIAGDHHGATFIPIGEKGEQHLHFLSVLLGADYVYF